jgi:tetratricopeptide (TPR) repeat protein
MKSVKEMLQNNNIDGTEFYDIYLSYNKSKRDETNLLYKDLTTNYNYSVFCDNSDNKTLVHDDFSTALSQCGIFICLIGKEYSNDLNCIRELNSANDLRIPIISLITEDVSMASLGAVGFIIAPHIRINCHRVKNFFRQLNKENEFYQTLIKSIDIHLQNHSMKLIQGTNNKNNKIKSNLKKNNNNKKEELTRINSTNNNKLASSSGEVISLKSNDFLPLTPDKSQLATTTTKHASLNPENEAVVLNREGVNYLIENKFESALEKFNAAIKIEPKNKKFLSNKANTLNNLKRYPSAIKSADKALEIDPTYQVAKVDKANALNAQGSEFLNNNNNYEKALAKFNSAIELDPNEKNYYSNKAAALTFLKKYKEAIEACDQCLQIDPDYTSAKKRKAYALEGYGIELLETNKDDYESALSKFEEAIQLDPSEKSYYSNKAAILNKMGRYDEAIEAADSALSIDSNYDVARIDKANALNGQGNHLFNELHQFRDSLIKYEEAIFLHEKQAQFHCNKAAVLNCLELYQEAIKSCDRALEIDPKCEDAKIKKATAFNNIGILNFTIF